MLGSRAKGEHIKYNGDKASKRPIHPHQFGFFFGIHYQHEFVLVKMILSRFNQLSEAVSFLLDEILILQ